MNRSESTSEKPTKTKGPKDVRHPIGHSIFEIRAQIAAGDPPLCPRCVVPLQEVEGPSASKVLLFEAYCPQCRHCLFLRHEDTH